MFIFYNLMKRFQNLYGIIESCWRRQVHVNVLVTVRTNWYFPDAHVSVFKIDLKLRNAILSGSFEGIQ
jgi:hypothetical protein